MKLALRTRLLVVSVALIGASVISAGAYLTRRLQAELAARIARELEVTVDLVADAAQRTQAPLEDFTSWDQLADDLAARSRARVTFVRASGAVAGDSGVALSELALVESHASRPEIRAAASSGRGHDLRRSNTLATEMTYVAQRFTHASGEQAFARVALPMEEVASATRQLHGLLAVATLVALLVAVVMSALAAEVASREPRRLVEVARKLAAGRMEARTRTRGDGELASVGQTLDSLADQLETALHELRAQRDLSAGVLQGMQEGVLVVDGNKRVALTNPALHRMLGLGDEVAGRGLLEVMRNAELAALLVRAEQGTALGEVETLGPEPRRLLVRAARLPPPSEALLAVVVDVTRVRRLEQLRRDFVANASHELRTPVAAIRAAAETLRTGALNDAGAAPRFVEIIERHGARLQGLIEDMLELSRIESGEHALAHASFDLTLLARRALALLAPLAEAKQIRLELKAGRMAVYAEADSGAVEQILSNLVGNAIKYCPEGARVEVAVESDERGAQLVVSDNGPGIGAEHVPRLFERFYRVDAGRSRELGGTGLGLAIVKHLTEAMGGEVSVQSELGRGATFRVRLPAPNRRSA